MNIGKGRWHSKYFCDKCGQEIPYIGQNGLKKKEEKSNYKKK